MSEPVRRRMSIAEFLDWQLVQNDRYELVDGRPRAMTGARIRHDRLTSNLLRILGTQFRATGNPCDAFTADIAIIVPIGNVRRPDVTVLCPPFDEMATASSNPRLVVEILSASTENVDRLIKLDEYKAIPSLDYILFASSELLQIGFWQRDDASDWQHQVIATADTVLDLPKLGIRMAAADWYDRVTVREPVVPRLVWPDAPSAP